MGAWKRVAVHPHGEERPFIHGLGDREAVRIPARAAEHHFCFCGARLDAGEVEDGRDRHAFPPGGGDQFPTDGVADALQRLIALHHGLRQELVIGQSQRTSHPTRHRQAPGGGVDVGIDDLFVHHVEAWI